MTTGWRLLDDDPIKTEWFSYDDMTGEQAIKTVYKDTDAVLDMNKSIQGKDVAKGKEGDWWHVARIPPSVIHKWLIEDGINVFDKEDGLRVMRKLDDPEWRHLRVNTGQLGVRKKVL